MNKCLVLTLVFFTKIAFSQVNDNFNDGNLIHPVWAGSNNSGDFIVEDGVLRSNSSVPSGSFYLSTENSLASNCTWEIYCNLRFATSGANFVDVYLISDRSDLQSVELNGYFVRIGDSSDDISLYKRSGTSIIKLIDGTDRAVTSSTNNKIKLKVTRKANFEFTLERDLTGTGNDYFSEGSASDQTFQQSAYSGLLIRQSTSSFFQKHFFDDFSISEIQVDQIPPVLNAIHVKDEHTLELVFDEALDPVSAGRLDLYDLEDVGKPDVVTIGLDQRTLLLHFAHTFESRDYTLNTSLIADKKGNQMGETRRPFSYKRPYSAKKGDIVLNEIFADPSPQIDLPGVEFVEIMNSSKEDISLENWTLSDAGSQAKLPAYVLKAGQYLILCAKSDTNEFKRYGAVLGIAPWPSLNNSGDQLKLLTQNNLLMDSVAYRDSWYRQPEKKSGGWSLELINPKAICSGVQNWTASRDESGGSPGRANSVYRTGENDPPLALIRARLKDSVTIELTFNRMADSLSASQTANYTVNNGLGKPVSVRLNGPDFITAELVYPSAIARGKRYEVEARDIADCTGIIISAGRNTAHFQYSEQIRKGDILISELLFNPRPEGVDFVEIYNHAEYEVNLQELSIASTKNDSLISIRAIADSERFMKPKTYLVLSTDPDNIKSFYHTENPEAFIKMSALPSFNDDAGSVVLLSGADRIDQFNYTSKMHFGLIKDEEGISLERASFNRPGNEPGNFRSAAASVGFATPGYKNSQAINDTSGIGEEGITLTSKRFSPDNDGFEDALVIQYKFQQPGMVATASIYNDKGILIKRLLRNATLASDGSIIWDGLDENNNRPGIGIYIVYMDVFDLNGNVKRFKKNCVLAARL